MSFRRWFLPLGAYSPLAHLPGPDWRSRCGLWDLTRPGVIEAGPGAVPCVLCVDAVEPGGSHAGGEMANRSSQSPSPLATSALVLLCGLLALLLVAAPAAAAAVTLAWDAPTLGMDGNPLTPEMAVTEYRVYQCPISVLGLPITCTLTNGLLVGTVPAPATTLDITGQTVPAQYFVTAVNKLGESGESNVVKTTKSGNPRNLRLQ